MGDPNLASGASASPKLAGEGDSGSPGGIGKLKDKNRIKNLKIELIMRNIQRETADDIRNVGNLHINIVDLVRRAVIIDLMFPWK